MAQLHRADPEFPPSSGPEVTEPLVRLEQPTAMSFDTRPRAVRKWIEGLPLANVGETTRRIYHALREVNHLEVPEKDRLKMLEALGGPLAVILPALERHFAFQPYPMPPKARRVAQLSIDLQKQLVTGYRLVIEHRPGSWLQQRAHEHTALAAIHHLLDCFDTLLATYREANIAYPRGLWRNVFRLYASASRQRRHTVEFASVAQPGEQSTIELVFRRILLLALVSPQKFGRAQMHEVVGSMSLWTPLLGLVASAELGTDPNTNRFSYCVLIASDRAPTLTSLSCTDDHCGPGLLLDTSAIEAHIQKILNAHPQERITLSEHGRHHILTRKVLTALLGNWCQPPQRVDARRRVNGHLQVTIGLRSLHYVLGEAERKRALGIPDDAVEENIELHSGEPAFIEPTTTVERTKRAGGIRAGEFLVDRDEEADVWQMTYAVPRADRQSWTDNVDVESAYRITEAEVLDASRNGYRLRLYGETIRRITVGDLLGIRSGSGKPWGAASVRWLSEQSDGYVQLGVQMLAGLCAPAHIRLKGGGSGGAVIEAIVGRDRESREVLMAPALQSLDHDRLLLERGGDQCYIRRTRLLMESPMFEARLFAADSAAPAAVTAPAKGKAAGTVKGPVTKGGVEDEYASLWSDL